MTSLRKLARCFFTCFRFAGDRRLPDVRIFLTAPHNCRMNVSFDAAIARHRCAPFIPFRRFTACTSCFFLSPLLLRRLLLLPRGIMMIIMSMMIMLVLLLKTTFLTAPMSTPTCSLHSKTTTPCGMALSCRHQKNKNKYINFL